MFTSSGDFMVIFCKIKKTNNILFLRTLKSKSFVKIEILSRKKKLSQNKLEYYWTSKEQ